MPKLVSLLPKGSWLPALTIFTCTMHKAPPDLAAWLFLNLNASREYIFHIYFHIVSFYFWPCYWNQSVIGYLSKFCLDSFTIPCWTLYTTKYNHRDPALSLHLIFPITWNNLKIHKEIFKLMSTSLAGAFCGPCCRRTAGKVPCRVTLQNMTRLNHQTSQPLLKASWNI